MIRTGNCVIGAGVLTLSFCLDICEDFPNLRPEVWAQFRRYIGALISCVIGAKRHMYIVAKADLCVAIDAFAARQVRSVRLHEERSQAHELAFVIGFAADRESVFERASIFG